MILNTRRLTEDNLNLIEQAREELHKLLSQQVKNLDQGFGDIIRKMEDKKYASEKIKKLLVKLIALFLPITLIFKAKNHFAITSNSISCKALPIE